jgi:hypothetical protein
MGRECKEPDPGSDRSSARRRGLFPLGMGFAGHRRDLVPRFISTVTHSEDDSGRYDKLILCQEDAPCP